MSLFADRLAATAVLREDLATPDEQQTAANAPTAELYGRNCLTLTRFADLLGRSKAGVRRRPAAAGIQPCSRGRRPNAASTPVDTTGA